MPLSILIPMVVLGIAGIALILHLLGYSRARTFAAAEEAQAAWLRQYPEDRVVRVLLSDDRQAALVQSASGAGVVWAIGADTTARSTTGGTVEEEKAGLAFRFPDVTAPALRVALHHPDARNVWLRIIRGETEGV